jgi:hypothetical protein
MDIYVERAKKFGRTAQQLAALPDGSIYLVHSEKFAGYCRGLLGALGRQPTAIRFATDSNFEMFIGERAPAMDVDHVFHRLAGRRGAEAEDFLRLTVTPYW